MSLRLWLGCGAFAALVLMACSSDQSVDPGTTPIPEAGLSLEVNYLTSSVPVDLATLPTIDYKSTKVAKLSDVWSASKIQADRTTLEFEFVGEDGFKPSSKTDCFDLPGTMLDKGYVDPSNRRLIWDETLGLAGCYGVKNAAKMNAHEPTDAGPPALDGAIDSPTE